MVTENYILMCEEATRLQDNWEPKPGDLIRRELTIFGEEIDTQIWDKEDLTPFEVLVRKPSIEGYWVATSKKEGNSVTLTDEDLTKNTCIWLPRQEDLQEILLKEFDTISENALFYAFLDWYNGTTLEGFNETWLAYTMQMCFDKQWNGSTWVKI